MFCNVAFWLELERKCSLLHERNVTEMRGGKNRENQSLFWVGNWFHRELSWITETQTHTNPQCVPVKCTITLSKLVTWYLWFEQCWKHLGWCKYKTQQNIKQHSCFTSNGRILTHYTYYAVIVSIVETKTSSRQVELENSVVIHIARDSKRLQPTYSMFPNIPNYHRC